MYELTLPLYNDKRYSIDTRYIYYIRIKVIAETSKFNANYRYNVRVG